MAKDLEKYLLDNNFDIQLKKLERKLKDKKIIVYGAGRLFEYINIKYNLSKLNIIAISDGKYSNYDEGKSFMGYKKILPRQIESYNPDYVLVSVLQYKPAIDSLRKNNIVSKKIKTIPFVKNSAPFKIFKIKNERYKKSVYILNKEFVFPKKHLLEIKQELDEQRNRILTECKKLITTSILHQKTFSEFKNKYQGKDIVLVGAGPSLNHFSLIKDAIYVGLNRTFLFDKIKFDYLFTIDKLGIQDYYEDFINYRQDSCIKFIGNQDREVFQIPHQFVYKTKNARNYQTTTNIYPGSFTTNIDTEPLGNFSTVSLQAMQFILFTNPKRVYLVGIDCSAAKSGYFKGKGNDRIHLKNTQQNIDDSSIKQWFELKQFATCHYPETEIISVNPVGLKGYFRDVYTKEYIENNPELFENKNAEILNMAEKNV